MRGAVPIARMSLTSASTSIPAETTTSTSLPTSTFTPVSATFTPTPTRISIVINGTVVVPIISSTNVSPTALGPTPVGGGTGEIAFASDRSGIPQIYLSDLGGTQFNPLRICPMEHVSPHGLPMEYGWFSFRPARRGLIFLILHCRTLPFTLSMQMAVISRRCQPLPAATSNRPGRRMARGLPLLLCAMDICRFTRSTLRSICHASHQYDLRYRSASAVLVAVQQ